MATHLCTNSLTTSNVLHQDNKLNANIKTSCISNLYIDSFGTDDSSLSIYSTDINTYISQNKNIDCLQTSKIISNRCVNHCGTISGFCIQDVSNVTYGCFLKFTCGSNSIIVSYWQNGKYSNDNFKRSYYFRYGDKYIPINCDLDSGGNNLYFSYNDIEKKLSKQSVFRACMCYCYALKITIHCCGKGATGCLTVTPQSIWFNSNGGHRYICLQNCEANVCEKLPVYNVYTSLSNKCSKTFCTSISANCEGYVNDKCLSFFSCCYKFRICYNNSCYLNTYIKFFDVCLKGCCSSTCGDTEYNKIGSRTALMHGTCLNNGDLK